MKFGSMEADLIIRHILSARKRWKTTIYKIVHTLPDFRNLPYKLSSRQCNGLSYFHGRRDDFLRQNEIGQHKDNVFIVYLCDTLGLLP